MNSASNKTEMGNIETRVKFTLRRKEFYFPADKTLRQTLEKLQLNPEAYLAVRNGEMITEDVLLRPGDIIKLVPVISGG